MAPTPKLNDYLVLAGGALFVTVFVFSVSLQYTKPSASSTVKTSELRGAGKTTSSLPHIIFILADDLGYNSIGYTDEVDQTTYGAAMTTVSPVLNSLGQNGIALTSYYAQEVCTPSRAALLTGRYPLSVGMQYGVVQPTVPWGLSLNETLISEVLADNGYDCHMLGKWHLGHHTSRYLPTARGFSSFSGYLNGDNYYFDKKNPLEIGYTDFTSANTTCYGLSSNASAYTEYSTHFYRDAAINIIEDYGTSGTQTNPLFLYLAFQAVHNPFSVDGAVVDLYGEVVGGYVDGIDTTYATTLEESVAGGKSLEYGLTLAVLDNAVHSIVQSLTDNGMASNTYLIFASDNGGCYVGGGKNAPLRGSKASLFEGGTKVDAFVYSPLLSSSVVGTTYDNLFHVTDWFPTILDMAGISYTEADGYEFDGVSHYDAMILGSDVDAPRDIVLYNAYSNVASDYGNYSTFDVWTDGTFAIRDSQYKLMHAYLGSNVTSYEWGDEVLADDDSIFDLSDCKQDETFYGEFSYMLFDLVNDPYESTNIYSSTDDDVVAAKEALYAKMFAIVDGSAKDDQPYVLAKLDQGSSALSVWDSLGSYLGPYLEPNYGTMSSTAADKSYPAYCGTV